MDDDRWKIIACQLLRKHAYACMYVCMHGYNAADILHIYPASKGLNDDLTVSCIEYNNNTYFS